MSLTTYLKLNGNTVNEIAPYVFTAANLDYSANGKMDSCATFNGISSTITCGSTIYLVGNESWSVSVWVKTTSSSTMSILSNSDGGPVSNDFRLEGGKIVYYHYYNTWLQETGTRVINDGNWHHLAWVNFTNYTMNMYIDGSLELYHVDSRQSWGAVNQIGKNWGSAYFNGQMDDFRIYTGGAMPESEIIELSFSKRMVAHWPMNGNLNDYSGNSSALTTASGDNIEVDGKIGKAYRKTWGYYNTGMTKIPEEVSIALWFRHNGTVWANECLFGTRTGDSGFMLYRNDGDVDNYYRVYFWYNNTSGSVVGYNPWPGLSGIAADTWYHLIMVRKANGDLKFYQDGALVCNQTAPADFSSWNNNNASLCFHGQGDGSYYTDGDLYFNDIRIYNYGLSEYEVKELAKAKILHYTFDDPNEEPTTNFVSGPLNPDNGWGTRTHTTVLVTDLVDKNMPPYALYGYKMTNTVNASTWSGNAYSYTNIRTHACTSGLKYTGSVWCFVSPESNLEWVQISSEGAGSGLMYYDLTKKGTWQRLVNTFTASSTTNSNTYLYFSLYGETTFTNMVGYVIFAAPQFEEKDHATPFVNGTRIAQAFDISSFRNHGTLYSGANIESNIDRKIGSYSMKFNGTGGFLTGPINVPAYTITFWANRDADSKMPIGSWNAGTSPEYDFYWYHDLSWAYTHGGVWNEYYYPKTDTISIGTWGHYAVTYDGANVKIYRNGKYEGQQASTGSANFASLAVGFGYASSYFYQGKLDDVRMYATALSATDILAIYNKRANLDNAGNFMTNELVERVNNAELIGQSIINKTFTNGLSEYEQANCQCTLTDDGYRIYRAPNLTIATNGYTMWGGFLAYFPNSCFIPGHNYEIQFKMKGQTSNDIETFFGYEAGWTTMGVGLPSRAATKDKSYLNFQSTTYQPVTVSYTVDSGRYAYPTWSCIITSGSTTVTYNGKHPSALNIVAGDFLVDSAYFPTHTKVLSVTANTSFVVDKAALSSATANLQSVRGYDTYRHFKFGFTYADTGVLGTDLYIKDFRVIDVTEDATENSIKSDGKAFFAELDEVSGTLNLNAKQELRDTGSLVINGEFSEIDN